MRELPHRYRVRVSGACEGSVTLASEGLPPIASAPPAEFGGPGDQWSPETLLLAAVGDCFALAFRAIAGASGLAWSRLECEVEGVLDRVERTTRFTEIEIRADLRIPDAGQTEKARRLLAKAEASCPVTNSLVAETRLDARIGRPE